MLLKTCVRRNDYQNNEFFENNSALIVTSFKGDI